MDRYIGVDAHASSRTLGILLRTPWKGRLFPDTQGRTGALRLYSVERVLADITPQVG